MSTCQRPPEHPEQDHEHPEQATDHPRPGTHWSPEEVETLRDLYPTSPWEDLLEALPGRSPCAIGCKAKALKIARETYHSMPGSHAAHRASPGGHTRNDFVIVGEGASTYAEIALQGMHGAVHAWTQVSLDDLLPLLDSGRWSLLRVGDARYAQRRGVGDEPSTVLMHREVQARVQGSMRTPSWADLPKGEERYVVDHIDGDGLDNRRSNLREITQSQNLRKSRKYTRRAPEQIGLPEGVRREKNRVIAIASIDRRGVSITRIDPNDHPTEEHAIALAACIRQAVQELIHGPDAIGVDATHRWRDLVSEDEALVWAVQALETRARYKLPMRERYVRRLEELRGRMG